MWFRKTKNIVEDSLNKLLDREHNPVNGFSEEETEVNVFVQKKLHIDDIHKKVLDKNEPWRFDDIVPEKINNKPTNVVELGEVYALRADDRKYRPVQGRAAISPKGSIAVGTAGVVGYVAKFHNTLLVGKMGAFHRILKKLGYPFEKVPVILTNKHVIAKNGLDSNIGVEIVQPTFGQVIAHVIWESNFTPETGGEDDGGLALLHTHIDYEPLKLVGIDTLVNGIKKIRYGMSVLKSGRTTRTTEGVCNGTNATILINFDFGRVRFRNCKIIKPTDEYEHFSRGGDSGSLVVEKDTGKAVGLIFAGNSRYSIACDIETIVEKSGIILE